MVVGRIGRCSRQGYMGNGNLEDHGQYFLGSCFLAFAFIARAFLALAQALGAAWGAHWVGAGRAPGPGRGAGP